MKKLPFHIVCIDDSQDSLDLLEMELGLVYETVSVFLDPRVALKYISKHVVDVVVSDFVMPEMSGIQLLRSVREKNITVPFLLLTGVGNDPVTLKSFNYQVFDIIDKPYTIEVLKNKINMALVFFAFSQNTTIPGISSQININEMLALISNHRETKAS